MTLVQGHSGVENFGCKEGFWFVSSLVQESSPTLNPCRTLIALYAGAPKGPLLPAFSVC